MNKKAVALIANEINPKKKKLLKKRIQSFKVTSSNGNEGLKLWYGLNPLSVSQLRGRIKRKGTRRAPAGAVFSSASNAVGTRSYRDGFVAKINQSKSIFSRVGTGRFDLEEKRIEIDDALWVALEDQIFDELPDVFFKHYSVDLRGRVAMRNA
ncbi:hypothetical protein [Marinagarivorans algicola]|uniref:hypothetical protein n=1 Tax=Marinagarivorans algicola TaxID=1513270 RepID=UPI0006B67FA6|nr:hypothetical protein [Marinagarivorans algicola]